jgi:hypothetical protein
MSMKIDIWFRANNVQQFTSLFLALCAQQVSCQVAKRQLLFLQETGTDH